MSENDVDSVGRGLVPRRGPDSSEFESAAALYRTCVTRPWTHDIFIQASTGWNGWTRLGTVLLALENWPEAHEAFKKALAGAPALIDAHLGLAESQLGLGHAAAALTTLETHLDAQGATDGWLLAAAAANLLGSKQDTQMFFAQAKARGLGKLLSRHRSALYDALSSTT